MDSSALIVLISWKAVGRTKAELDYVRLDVLYSTIGHHEGRSCIILCRFFLNILSYYVLEKSAISFNSQKLIRMSWIA